MSKEKKLKHKVRVFNKDGVQIDPFNYKAPDHIAEAIRIVMRKGGVK